MLNAQQIEQFHQNGYLILPDYAPNDEIFKLKSHIQEIIQQQKLNTGAIFSTKGEDQHTDLSYFLESGDKIRCFFEEATAEQQQRQINKVGHNLHDLDPIFKQFSYQEKLFQLALSLGMEEPGIIQSQYIFKSPGVGGEVTPHTDSTFLYTEPLSCLGIWIALDDATLANGCLWALPGSHSDYPLYQRYVRNETGTATEFISLTTAENNWATERQVPLVVKRGTAILLHGSVVHSSQRNNSLNSRNAFVLHLIDKKAHYPKDNWLQREEAPRPMSVALK